jgi:hypothetical protein
MVFFRFNLEAMCYRIRNINFLLKYGSYSHVNVLYESTSCHEHSCRRDDARVFPNRLDPLDRTQSNLFDELTWGAISTTPRVAALGVVLTSCHEHDSHRDDARVFPNRLDPLNRTQSNLFDELTWGAISTTPRVAALGVVSTSCHEHDSHCDDDRVFS